MMPVSFNVTLLNPMAPASRITVSDVQLNLKGRRLYEDPGSQKQHERHLEQTQKQLLGCLDISIDYPEQAYPFFGNIKITFATNRANEHSCRLLKLDDVELVFSFTLDNYSPTDEKILFKMLFDFIPTPQRRDRVLFDQFHSLKYPENGYVLRDSLLNTD